MALDPDILNAVEQTAPQEQQPVAQQGLDPGIMAAITPRPAGVQQQQQVNPTAMAIARVLPRPVLNALLKAQPTMQKITQSAPFQGVLGASDVSRMQLSRLLPSQIRPQTRTFSDPTRLAAKVGGFGGTAADIAGLTALSGLTGLRAAVGPILEQALIGAGISENRLEGAGLGALGGVASEYIVPAGLRLLKNIGKKVGVVAGKVVSSPDKVADTMAQDIRGDLLAGKAPEQVPGALSNKVENNYTAQRNGSTKMYKNSQDLADKAGFKISYHELPKTQATLENSAELNIHPGTQRTIDKLMDRVTSPEGKIADYNEIHNQIIKLGERSSSLYKPGTFEDSGALRQIKNALMDDIKDHAVKMGHKEIADSLEAANTNYRSNVAPYFTKGVFGKIIKGDVAPDEVGNILSKAENSKVLDDLDDEGRKLVLHEKLKGATKLTPKGEIVAEPEKWWSRFSRLHTQNPALAKRLRDDAIRQKFFSLGTRLQRAGKPINNLFLRSLITAGAMQEPTAQKLLFPGQRGQQ